MPSTDDHQTNTLAIAAALDQLWAAIRDRHRDVPASTAVLGHREGRAAPAWGHHAYYHQAGADTVPEIVIDPETITDHNPLGILERMLHEAAHALAATRTIKDTSNETRYHNKRFAKLAAEVGLTVPAKSEAVYGFRPTGLADGTAEAYAAPLMDLADARNRPWRWPLETPEVRSAHRSTWIAAACACIPANRIRCASTLLEAAAPHCPICQQPYRPVPAEKP